MNFLLRNKHFLFLLIIACIGYWQVAFFQQILKWDTIDQYYPWRMFVVQCLHNNILPLWNPYAQFGYPMHADPQSGVWYPVVWLFSLFGEYTLYSSQVEYMIHIIGGGMGMLLLIQACRIGERIAFFGACAYMFCGLFIGNAQHLTFIIAACWMPFIFWSFIKIIEQQRFIFTLLFSLFCFLLLSGGYPAFTISVFYILLLSTIFIFIKRLKARQFQFSKMLFLNLSIAVVLILVLSSGLLLSVYQSMPYLARADGLNYEVAAYGAFSPQSLLSLLFPLASAKNSQFFGTDISMSSIYMGSFVLALFIHFLHTPKKKYEILILVATVFFLLASFGSYTPVRRWLFDYIPMMNLFRFPSIFRLFVILGFIFLATVTASKLKNLNALAPIFISLALLNFLVFVLAGFTFNGWPFTSHYTTWFAFINNLTMEQSICLQAMTQCIIFVVFGFIVRSGLSSNNKWSLVLVVSLFDLMLAAQLNMPINVVDKNDTHEVAMQVNLNTIHDFPVPVLQPIKFNNDSGGYIAPFWRNLNLFKKQPAWDGYNSFQLKNYVRFVDDEPLRNEQLNNNWLFFSDTVVFYADTINCSLNQFASVLYINQNDKSKVAIEKDSANSVNVLDFKPGRVQAVAQVNSAAANLTLMQQYYPGWEIFVDDEPVVPIVSSYLFMTVKLSHGMHTLSYVYDNKAIRVAWWISRIGLCVVVLLIGYLYFIKHHFNGLPG
jgi:hypothetical protein